MADSARPPRPPPSKAVVDADDKTLPNLSAEQVARALERPDVTEPALRLAPLSLATRPASDSTAPDAKRPPPEVDPTTPTSPVTPAVSLAAPPDPDRTETDLRTLTIPAAPLPAPSPEGEPAPAPPSRAAVAKSWFAAGGVGVLVVLVALNSWLTQEVERTCTCAGGVTRSAGLHLRWEDVDCRAACSAGAPRLQPYRRYAAPPRAGVRAPEDRP